MRKKLVKTNFGVLELYDFDPQRIEEWQGLVCLTSMNPKCNGKYYVDDREDQDKDEAHIIA